MFGTEHRLVSFTCLLLPVDWVSGPGARSTGLATVQARCAHVRSVLSRSLEGSTSRSSVHWRRPQIGKMIVCANSLAHPGMLLCVGRLSIHDALEGALPDVARFSALIDGAQPLCPTHFCCVISRIVSRPGKSGACGHCLRRVQNARMQPHARNHLSHALYVASPLIPEPTDLTRAHVTAMGKKSKATLKRQGKRQGKWQRNHPEALQEDADAHGDAGAAASTAANAHHDDGAAASTSPVGLPLEVRVPPTERPIEEDDELAPALHLQQPLPPSAMPEPVLDAATLIMMEPVSSSSGTHDVSQAMSQVETIESSPELLPAFPSPPTPPRPRREIRAVDEDLELIPDERVNRIGGEMRRVSYPPLVEQREGETRMAYLRRAIAENLAFQRRKDNQRQNPDGGKKNQSSLDVCVLHLAFIQKRAHIIHLAWSFFVAVCVFRSRTQFPPTTSPTAGPRASAPVCTVCTSRASRPKARHPQHSRTHPNNRADPGPKSWSRGYISTWLRRIIVFISPTLSQCVPVKPRVSPVTAAGEGAPNRFVTSGCNMGVKNSGEGHILLHPTQHIRKNTLKKAVSNAKGTSVTHYRGRMLRVESHEQPTRVSPAPNSPRPPMHAPPKRRHNRRLSILSYNCGGLTSALYTELLVWLQLHRPDVVFLQETHWAQDRTYTAEDWHVISSGCSAHHSGVMIMLAKRSFPQPCIRSEILIPGRLMIVKAHQHNTTHFLINVYQKVNDGTKDGQDLRNQVWEALQKAISISPSRHSLIVAGDFNTSLQSRTPCTGTAIINKGSAAEAVDVHVFQQLLKQFDLRALNTFQPEPCKHTYQHPGRNDVKSQIDYILIRGRRGDSRAKLTHTFIDTDLGAWRGGPKH